MKLKDNEVEFKSLAPQLVLGLLMANEVYSSHGIDMVITSANDSRHSYTSLHWSGNAVDLRTSTIPVAVGAKRITEEIKQKLNKDFDVVLEKDHIHLEYQPKMRDK